MSPVVGGKLHGAFNKQVVEETIPSWGARRCFFFLFFSSFFRCSFFWSSYIGLHRVQLDWSCIRIVENSAMAFIVP